MAKRKIYTLSFKADVRAQNIEKAQDLLKKKLKDNKKIRFIGEPKYEGMYNI